MPTSEDEIEKNEKRFTKSLLMTLLESCLLAIRYRRFSFRSVVNLFSFYR